MKRSVLFSVLILVLVSMPFLTAVEIEDQLNASYTCLENKVKDNCDSLSSEEKIFSLLAIGECKSEVLADSANDECWPKSGCKLKTTAQAILALDNSNTNVEEAKTWLFSQNAIPPEIDWYLEIESTEATTCTITYDGVPYPINIGTDRKINIGAGSCLKLSEPPYADYWLKVSSTCYNKEFDVSCDKSFLTTLLYKKSNSPTMVYVSDKTSSASADGTTTEAVNFSCFKQGDTCDYEGSLWASFVLDALGEDISAYKPYLTTMAEDNKEYLPEAFLYLIEPSDTNFRAVLLSKQQNNKWWLASEDKYYDTALALLPFQNENPTEKTNAKNWLLEVQDSEGCWQGNIRNTAFLLYAFTGSIASLGSSSGGTSLSCEDIGYCASETSCADIGGSQLSTYSFSCPSGKICCDSELSSQTCTDINGEICNSDEECIGSTTETLDTYECCTGYCEAISPIQSECDLSGGSCRDSCLSDEESNSEACDYPGEICCADKDEPAPTSYWWIWVLLILIVLAVMGIIFRDKLRPAWLRIKSKFKKKPKPSPELAYPRTPMRRPMSSGVLHFPQRPLPSGRTFPSRRPMHAEKPKSEVDDILKKLKEIGK